MSNSKRKTILVLGPREDCASVRKILGKNRFDVVKVSSVDEVVELALGASAIICDTLGAQQRGWKAVLERALQAKPWITFIVSSYRSDDKLSAAVADAGGYCAIKKPFSKEALEGLFGSNGSKIINASCFI